MEAEARDFVGWYGITALGAGGFEVLGLDVVASFTWHGKTLGEYKANILWKTAEPLGVLSGQRGTHRGRLMLAKRKRIHGG